MKKFLKIFIDVLMFADFLYLMNHGVARNLTCHGIFGIILFVLFIFHHLLNLWFYKSVFKGKWNKKKIVLNITDWLLFFLMILMALSSIMMSGLVFESSPFVATQGWRTLHLMSSSWGFIVMSVHLGLHTNSGLKKIELKCSKTQKIFFYSVLLLIAAAGIFCFIKTQLYVFMFNTGNWKMAAPDILTGFIEYIGITSGLCSFVYFFMKLLNLKGSSNK